MKFFYRINEQKSLKILKIVSETGCCVGRIMLEAVITFCRLWIKLEICSLLINELEA